MCLPHSLLLRVNDDASIDTTFIPLIEGLENTGTTLLPNRLQSVEILTLATFGAIRVREPSFKVYVECHD